MKETFKESKAFFFTEYEGKVILVRKVLTEKYDKSKDHTLPSGLLFYIDFKYSG